MAAFTCEHCGFVGEADGDGVATAACPHCGRDMARGGEAEPTEADLHLDDLIEERPFEQAVSTSGPYAAPGGSALDGPDLGPGLGRVDPDAVRPGFLDGGLGPNLGAGLATGLLLYFFGLAYAALVFCPEALADFYPAALGMVLVGTLVTGLAAALRSRFTFVIAGPGTAITAVLSTIALSIHHQMADSYDALSILATTVAAVGGTALVTGLAAFILARLRVGGLFRYMPVQILGGVQAGLGVVVLHAAYLCMTGNDFVLDGLQQVLTGSVAASRGDALWIASLAFGLGLLIIGLRRRSSYGLLAVVLAAVALWHAGPLVSPDSGLGSFAGGALGKSFGTDAMLALFSPGAVAHIQWSVLLRHDVHMATAALLGICLSLARVNGLELVGGEDADLNRELGSIGWPNIVSGLLGGMPGTISRTRSLRHFHAGGRGRLSTLTAILVCSGLLAASGRLLPLLPRFLPSGMLLFLGAALIKRWLIDTRRSRLRSDDYALLVLTFLATAIFGVIIGTGLGVGMTALVTVKRHAQSGAIRQLLSGSRFRSNVDRGARPLQVLRERGGMIFGVRLQGFLFQGAMHDLLRRVRERLEDWEEPALRYLLLDFRAVTGFGSSVETGFGKLWRLAAEHELTLVFTNLSFELGEQLAAMGCDFNDENSPHQVFMDMDYGMEWCENHVLAEAGLAPEDPGVGLPELLAQLLGDSRIAGVLLQLMPRVELEVGEYLFRKGDPSDAMYFVESGLVDIELPLAGGKLLRLKKTGAGTVVGEMGLYTQTPRSASIVAAGPCVLYKLSAERFRLIQAKAPTLGAAIHRMVVNILAGRVNDANAKVRDLTS